MVLPLLVVRLIVWVALIYFRKSGGSLFSRLTLTHLQLCFAARFYYYHRKEFNIFIVVCQMLFNLAGLRFDLSHINIPHFTVGAIWWSDVTEPACVWVASFFVGCLPFLQYSPFPSSPRPNLIGVVFRPHLSAFIFKFRWRWQCCIHITTLAYKTHLSTALQI